MLINDVCKFENKKLDDGGFSTDEVCSLCGRSTEIYIKIPIIWEKDQDFLICISCINICEQKINEESY